MFFSQADYEKLRSQCEAELSSKLESKTKGMEKIAMENERLRKRIKRVRMETAHGSSETWHNVPGTVG